MKIKKGEKAISKGIFHWVLSHLFELFLSVMANLCLF